MNIDGSTIIGDIVKVNFKTAQVFDKNKIDFCCGGQISLREACEESKIEMTNLIPELEALVQTNDPDSKYIDSLELDELSDYIEKRHHTYVRENIPFLVQKLQKLCDVHGENHKELFEIKELFDGAAENLSAHMQKEEVILFPYIRKMIQHKKENIPAGAEFGQILQPIQVMEQEHQLEGERFKTISGLTQEYTCPPDGCTTFQITYKTLQDFETDLHRHIHLESNILFKKALILEKELVS
jgi:regulator of cell morphogenesis and NO signaling